MVQIPGADSFHGEILHSSKLDSCDAKDKKIAIIGGGASHISILARSDKWIIPRNVVVNALLSFNILGRETQLSWIPETLLRTFFYRDLASSVAPAANVGLFTGTPMVNSAIMDQLRRGQADWIRGDVQEITPRGLRVIRRSPGTPKGGPGHEELVDADIIVLATGFHRPSLAFLPADCFRDPYRPPNWYLQTFPPAHPSVSAINATYVDAIGTVGNWHIGIYTRILLMFLADPLTRPSPAWMRRWIRLTRLLKTWSPVGALDFFTYLELVWWFVFCVVINPFRWKWALFVFFGVGFDLPNSFAELEKRVLDTEGYRKRDQGRSL